MSYLFYILYCIILVSRSASSPQQSKAPLPASDVPLWAVASAPPRNRFRRWPASPRLPRRWRQWPPTVRCKPMVLSWEMSRSEKWLLQKRLKKTICKPLQTFHWWVGWLCIAPVKRLWKNGNHCFKSAEGPENLRRQQRSATLPWHDAAVFKVGSAGSRFKSIHGMTKC